MNSLVFVKRNDLFTDSLVISNETENAHESVLSLINKYSSEFGSLGKVEFSYYLKSDSLQSEGKVVLLNEMQATFLITLLKNSAKVLKFKLALVKEFYRMREVLMERRTTEWLQTREKGKLIRRDETDAIQLLIPYAGGQGSKNMMKQAYVVYTKLVNKAVGIETGKRGSASYKKLMLVALMEDIISNTILEEMENGTYYKKIYEICKTKIYAFVALTYLNVS